MTIGGLGITITGLGMTNFEVWNCNLGAWHDHENAGQGMTALHAPTPTGAHKGRPYDGRVVGGYFRGIDLFGAVAQELS